MEDTLVRYSSPSSLEPGHAPLSSYADSLPRSYRGGYSDAQNNRDMRAAEDKYRNDMRFIQEQKSTLCNQIYRDGRSTFRDDMYCLHNR